MPSRRFEYVVLFIGLAVTAALVALDARQWHRSHAEPAARLLAAADTRSIASGTAAVADAKVSRAPTIATLVLTASRGDCWVSARTGSSTGASLYEGKLARGQKLRLARSRLWLRLGAAGNLRATLNGRALDTFPQGTVDIVVTPGGVAQAARA
jgi:hypothetical protein